MLPFHLLSSPGALAHGSGARTGFTSCVLVEGRTDGPSGRAGLVVILYVRGSGGVGKGTPGWSGG